MDKINKLLVLLAAVVSVLAISRQAVAEEDTLVVATFESPTNNLGGSWAIFGTPYDTYLNWFYGPQTANYDPRYVHSGNKSFRLVNTLSTMEYEARGIFSMDLGRTVDNTCDPQKIESKDVSKYKYLTFWVKGERGGEKLEVLFRDSHAPSYMPQAKYAVANATTEWTKVSVPLDEIRKQGVDLKSLDNIGISFDPGGENKQDDRVYIDDFAFTR